MRKLPIRTLTNLRLFLGFVSVWFYPENLSNKKPSLTEDLAESNNDKKLSVTVAVIDSENNENIKI